MFPGARWRFFGLILRGPFILEGEGGRHPAYYVVPHDPRSSSTQGRPRLRMDEGVPLRLYTMVFVLLALLDITVSKLSRRREGFKSTPLDFLIVLLAVLVLNPRNGACRSG